MSTLARSSSIVCFVRAPLQHSRGKCEFHPRPHSTDALNWKRKLMSVVTERWQTRTGEGRGRRRTPVPSAGWIVARTGQYKHNGQGSKRARVSREAETSGQPENALQWKHRSIPCSGAA